jgi:hypothetical protein
VTYSGHCIETSNTEQNSAHCTRALQAGQTLRGDMGKAGHLHRTAPDSCITRKFGYILEGQYTERPELNDAAALEH